MPYLREVREVLLYSHLNGTLDHEKFALLYDINSNKNPDLPHWAYQPFNLDEMDDAECKTEFRFFKNDIYNLIDVLNIPQEFVMENNLHVSGEEGFSIFLKRFAYPCRYSDMVPRFARAVPQLCMISNKVMWFIYNRWNHLLTSFNQPWLSPANLDGYAGAIHQKGAALENCWGFVDGTIRRICRPGENQRILYNGHKRVNAIKFQSVAAPNGLVENLYGPVEGKRHDSGMLADSALLNNLQIHSHSPNGRVLCIYGDPAYPLRQHLQAPFKGARLTPQQIAWNQSMNEVRVSVEWIFGDIVNSFMF